MWITRAECLTSKMNKRYTWRLLFKRLFAKARHGVTEQLEVFITVFDSSSAIRTASSKMWFWGNIVQQSNVAFRTKLIMLVLIETSSELLKTCSKLVSLWLLPSLVKKLRILLSSSKRESGIASKLRLLSAQLELFVQVLRALKGSNLYKLIMFLLFHSCPVLVYQALLCPFGQ